MRFQLYAQMTHRSRTFGLTGLLNKSFIQTKFSTSTIYVPYVPTAKAAKILVKGNCAESKRLTITRYIWNELVGLLRVA